MTDEYPPEWGYQPEREEAPTVADRPITSLRSALHTEPVDRAAEYPPEWGR